MDQENYPNNFEEFIEQFQTEKDCIEYISSIRWPNKKFSQPKSNYRFLFLREFFVHCTHSSKNFIWCPEEEGVLV